MLERETRKSTSSSTRTLNMPLTLPNEILLKIAEEYVSASGLQTEEPDGALWISVLYYKEWEQEQQAKRKAIARELCPVSRLFCEFGRKIRWQTCKLVMKADDHLKDRVNMFSKPYIGCHVKTLELETFGWKHNADQSKNYFFDPVKETNPATINCLGMLSPSSTRFWKMRPENSRKLSSIETSWWIMRVQFELMRLIPLISASLTKLKINTPSDASWRDQSYILHVMVVEILSRFFFPRLRSLHLETDCLGVASAFWDLNSPPNIVFPELRELRLTTADEYIELPHDSFDALPFQAWLCDRMPLLEKLELNSIGDADRGVRHYATGAASGEHLRTALLRKLVHLRHISFTRVFLDGSLSGMIGSLPDLRNISLNDCFINREQDRWAAVFRALMGLPLEELRIAAASYVVNMYEDDNCDGGGAGVCTPYQADKVAFEAMIEHFSGPGGAWTTQPFLAWNKHYLKICNLCEHFREDDTV